MSNSSDSPYSYGSEQQRVRCQGTQAAAATKILCDGASYLKVSKEARVAEVPLADENVELHVALLHEPPLVTGLGRHVAGLQEQVRVDTDSADGVDWGIHGNTHGRHT